MKTRNANIGPFSPCAKGKAENQRGTLRLDEYRAEHWDWRNVVINAEVLLLSMMVSAFVAGALEMSKPLAALTGVLIGCGAGLISLDLFPLKTREVTNVRRPQD